MYIPCLEKLSNAKSNIKLLYSDTQFFFLILDRKLDSSGNESKIAFWILLTPQINCIMPFLKNYKYF